MTIILSIFDQWLQEAVTSKPADFGLVRFVKFCSACILMLALIYPVHRVAIPLIHESGHFVAAKLTGKTPPLFVVGNRERNIWIDVTVVGTRFVISPKGSGSQVLLASGQKTCLIALGGPLATAIVVLLGGIWCWRHKGKPITIMYVVMLAVCLDATASTLVNAFSSLPGADGVFLRSCLDSIWSSLL